MTENFYVLRLIFVPEAQNFWGDTRDPPLVPLGGEDHDPRSPSLSSFWGTRARWTLAPSDTTLRAFTLVTLRQVLFTLVTLRQHFDTASIFSMYG